MRPIDADILRERLQDLAYDDWNQGIIKSFADVCNEIIEIVEEQPPVNAVPVIRCKDCKHWLPHAQFGFDEDNNEYHNYCGRLVPDDDYYAFTREADEFCSRAERKDNG